MMQHFQNSSKLVYKWEQVTGNCLNKWNLWKLQVMIILGNNIIKTNVSWRFLVKSKTSRFNYHFELSSHHLWLLTVEYTEDMIYKGLTRDTSPPSLYENSLILMINTKHKKQLTLKDLTKFKLPGGPIT